MRTRFVLGCLAMTAVSVVAVSSMPDARLHVEVAEMPNEDRCAVTVLNNTSRPVTLAGISGSCPCVHARGLPAVVEPGEQHRVTVTVPAERLAAYDTRFLVRTADGFSHLDAWTKSGD